MFGALSGFRVGITADRRAEEQAELIARRGGETVLAPVIRTSPLGDETLTIEATRRIIAEPPDVVVFATALGVRGWCSSAEGLDLLDDLREAFGPAEVLARGPKASGAATTYGIDVDWVTPTATYDELLGRLASSVATTAEGRPVRVAVQLDGEPGPELANRIAALGFDVVAVPVYRWDLPMDTGPAARLAAAVAARTVDAITFTSAHAVKNFATIAESSGQLEPVLDAVNAGAVAAVAVGPVTAATIRSIGIAECIEPRHPRLGALVQALVTSFVDRSTAMDLRGIPVLLQGRLVSISGSDPVRLTDRERDLLGVLARQPGAVVSKERLLREVWAGESDDHVVEVTVGRLRRRLGPAGDRIQTVTRRGYRLMAS